MTNRRFPWELLFWSVIGPVALRPVFPDNEEYLGACFVYALCLGLVFIVIRDLIHGGDDE